MRLRVKVFNSTGGDKKLEAEIQDWLDTIDAEIVRTNANERYLFVFYQIIAREKQTVSL